MWRGLQAQGTGLYQRRLAGKNTKVRVEAQILAVADVVEAISAHRPYRAALGIKAGIEEIKKGRGVIYNSDVVDACVKLIEKQGFTFIKKDSD